MSKNTYIILGVIAVIVVAGAVMWLQRSGGQGSVPPAPTSTGETPAAPTPPPQQQPEISSPPAQPQVEGPAAAPAQSNIVSYTGSGYSPATLRVTAGTTVTFRNNGSGEMWPASAVHPTHKVYPGSGIEKCGTSEESKIFDACRGIAPGSAWSFKFDQVGSWNYHNHLNPSFRGTIVVE